MAPLPNRVDFRKIINNILKSIKFLNKSAENYGFKQKEGQDTEDQSKFERWLKYLQLPESVALVSDSFWYAICKFFNPGVYEVNNISIFKGGRGKIPRPHIQELHKFILIDK